MHSDTPWDVTSERGTPGTPVDNDFFMYPMYGGFQESMRRYYPNYPTAYVNLGGLPYADSGMYGGFLAGFIDESKQG